jgi:RHS repeat-associated protein
MRVILLTMAWGRLRARGDYYNAIGSELSYVGTTYYVYDGKRVIQERDSNNVPVASYTRGLDLSGTLQGAGGIGGLLARSSAYSGGNWTSHAFYHADGNGNVTYLETSAEAVAASYRYDPFGNTISKSGTLADANTYRFSSKEINTYSGMYYYLHRFYDPPTQRWINRDPLGDRAFQDLGRFASSRRRVDSHLFIFAENDPVSLLDPLGLATTPWPLNGKVCNCSGNNKPVYVLIDGNYFTLPAGQCTASKQYAFDDVDGVWIGDRFYKVGCGQVDACHPPDHPCEGRCDACPWDSVPGSPTSPSQRSGYKQGDFPPIRPPPRYRPPINPFPEGGPFPFRP